MTKHIYNQAFMKYAAQSSAYSAATITSILRRLLDVESVLDVGCAAGTWLRAWNELGIADLHGIDGDYVDRQMFMLPASKFTAVDLNAAFDLGRQFDLVQSLEVGEHLKETASKVFAESLARHARRYILFSAAPPGQGGEYHINEQPYEFWRHKFERLGFVPVDAVRPAIVKDKRISFWYRYNTLLFVRRELLPEIGGQLRDKVILSGQQIEDVSPLLFHLRKWIVRRLPKTVQHEIARLKAKLLPTGRI
jgi:SAM-dependent methyltransferase